MSSDPKNKHVPRPLTTMEQHMFDAHTEKRPSREPDAEYNVFLRVGVQSFCITREGSESGEHADWMRRMLAIALAKVFEDLAKAFDEPDGEHK